MINRWKEAFDTGYGPKVVLESTHSKSLQVKIYKYINKYNEYQAFMKTRHTFTIMYLVCVDY